MHSVEIKFKVSVQTYNIGPVTNMDERKVIFMVLAANRRVGDAVATAKIQSAYSPSSAGHKPFYAYIMVAEEMQDAFDKSQVEGHSKKFSIVLNGLMS